MLDRAACGRGSYRNVHGCAVDLVSCAVQQTMCEHLCLHLNEHSACGPHNLRLMTIWHPLLHAGATRIEAISPQASFSVIVRFRT